MHGASLSPLPLDAETTASTQAAQARPRRGPVPATPLRVVRSGSSAGPVADLDPGTEPEASSETVRTVSGDLLLYLILTALVAAAWQITEMRLFKSSDDTSYWIAVVGGSMMLLLFSYPLRKHLRFMQGLGKVKWWFWFHLFLGIAGPWLILLHSGFHIGSVNAGVAIFSMGIVVASGVVGRFIYVRVHRGLHGEQTSLSDLRRKAGMVESNARSRLHFLPTVEARLLAFEQHEMLPTENWATHLRRVLLLPVQRQIAYLRCVADLRHRLRDLAIERQWSADDIQRRERRARRLIDRYLNAVVRVLQYKAYERVFALWHVAHLPFVYLMVISAVVHVIAVHAY